MSFKIVFMGTPDFAIPSLQMLIEQEYDVAAVVTQPDRKAGRGHKIASPPVKRFAEAKGIPVHQFEKVSTPQGVEKLRAIAPDLLITAAFGHILSEEILCIPQYGCINVHASLLPKLRGAAPIQWAIITGEKQTGITTMYTVKELDAGDILEQDSVDIPEDMTAGELYGVLSGLGAVTLRRTLRKLNEGVLVRTPQDETKATYFPMFKKTFGEIDFSDTCEAIINLVRGLNPCPGAYIMYGEEKIRVYRAVKTKMQSDLPCGSIFCADNKRGLLVVAANGVLSLEEIKWEGAKAMDARASLCGRQIDCRYCFSKISGEDAY
jgi:methionyl-tRNA formyltransferase